MIERTTLVICEHNGCKCKDFKLCICENYDMIIYECCHCGHIETHYFGDMK